ncbi:hypothetical protein GCM10010315_14440 [Streptomyces luteosporeus]|uniref:Rhodanese domain-containing protein n=1 Tax=Streptomyces luteosporeus TaxID=173856 RepID=A0ABN3TMS8_9ACTN
MVERNELEWRLDPACAHRSARATHHALPVVVFCDEGYASSLAAVSLRRLGLRHATDLVGGFQAWRAAGLPVDTLPVDAATQEAVDTAVEAVPAGQSSGRKAPRTSGSSPSSASACRTTRRASPSE